jgi:prefoldin subunit 5
MNVTIEQIFAKLGRLQVERDLLQAQNDELNGTVAELLGQVKALREDKAKGETLALAPYQRNGDVADGSPVED